jgi:hypothetical protein
MAAHYIPQPGTIPAKVLAYLRAQPPGTELATRPLMDAIDSAVSGGLSNYLQCAVQGGALACRPHPDDRRTQLWRLGDGAAVVQQHGGPVAEVVAPADQAGAPTASTPARQRAKSRALPAEASPRTVAALRIREQPAPVEAAAPGLPDAAADMRIGLWNTGDLVIERRGEWIEFSVAEVRVLASYLRDMQARHPVAS